MTTILALWKARVFKNYRRLCPLCGWHGEVFAPFGRVPRRDAKCPKCDSLERHRFAWEFLRASHLLESKRAQVLHFAPEKALGKLLQSKVLDGYVSADIARKAMIKEDIMCLTFPERSFDGIVCIHVLMHVKDDVKAISECYRVLKGGGWAVFQVMLNSFTRTVDGSHIESPDVRERMFGCRHQFRSYGRDLLDLLKTVGFRVTLITPEALLGRFHATTIGSLSDANSILFCERVRE